MSPNIYNCRLNTINIVVSLIIVLIPAIDWVLYSYQQFWRAFVIVGLSENGCLAISCVFLVWGFQRLIKTVQSVNDHIVNTSMIVWHIVAYFFIVIANTAQFFLLKTLK